MRNPAILVLKSAIAAVALAGAAMPLSAGEVRIVVSADNIDFSDAADVEVMKERIDVAVTRACNTRSRTSFYGAKAVDACIADGTAKALAELDKRLAGI